MSCPYLQGSYGGFFSASTYFCGVTKTKLSDTSVSSTCRDKYYNCVHYKKERSSGSGCYLTSACLVSMGSSFRDNCYELEALRNFRDTFVRQVYPKDVIFYNNVAPHIVASISRLNDSASVYETIYNELVLEAVSLIEKNMLQEAYELYKSYSLYLQNEYL